MLCKPHHKSYMKFFDWEYYKISEASYMAKQRSRRTGYSLLKLLFDNRSTPIEKHSAFRAFINTCGIGFAMARVKEDQVQAYLNILDKGNHVEKEWGPHCHMYDQLGVRSDVNPWRDNNTIKSPKTIDWLKKDRTQNIQVKETVKWLTKDSIVKPMVTLESILPK